MIRYGGFWRMFFARTFLKLLRQEWEKSFFLKAVVAEAARLIPSLRPGDMLRSRAGIRAHLVARDGRMVDDLVLEETVRSVHMLNAVSPALTCSLPFADHVAGLALAKL